MLFINFWRSKMKTTWRKTCHKFITSRSSWCLSCQLNDVELAAEASVLCHPAFLEDFLVLRVLMYDLYSVLGVSVTMHYINWHFTLHYTTLSFLWTNGYSFLFSCKFSCTIITLVTLCSLWSVPTSLLLHRHMYRPRVKPWRCVSFSYQSPSHRTGDHRVRTVASHPDSNTVVSASAYLQHTMTCFIRRLNPSFKPKFYTKA